MDIPRPLLLDIERAAGMRIASACAASGGSINQSLAITAENGIKLFVKFNPAAAADFFAAEFFNLQALNNVQGIRAAKVIAESSSIAGRESEIPFLLLEYIEPGRKNAAAEADLGGQLAVLHAARFPVWGFDIDNIIGSLPQRNTRNMNWTSWGEFFFEERLNFQAELGQSCGWADRRFCGRLAQRREEWIARLNSRVQEPVLVHGDLWSGNVVWGRDGPVLIDPACYWGSGEVDLAMSELFGGFGESFRQAYWEQCSNSDRTGFDQRKDILNLYHLMTHANMFGGGYVRQVKQQVG